MKNLIFKIKTLLKPFAKLLKYKWLRRAIIHINGIISAYIYKRAILEYYKNTEQDLEPEKKKVLDFLKHNPISLYPYEFTKKYRVSEVKVYDDIDGLKYTFIQDKKIYFKKGLQKKEAAEISNALCTEQDIESPHRYLTENFNINENDIVADVGAAEGSFSLSIIEKVKKAYLFETDPLLIESLKKTFKPWENKVVIVNKYISNHTTDTDITFDDYFKDKESPTFIKVDIEGEEHNFLKGAENLLSEQKNIKIILACYHRHNDENSLNQMLKNFDFQTEYSKGFMLSIWDDILKQPFLRRGLIRAKK